ncbi:hypothetical protein HII36_09960 [Nonomuraea sp. NN258]|uniref:hypothetical protein n=1 Tax=Nonomuraea antri TaxID=2730852 RepID=UPI00156A288F|nr:hypothetical protein [Nonomuraea antri]NRQ32157.1 hypothetical protein [Nonomuraea antri]
MTADLLAERVTNLLAPQVLVIAMPPFVGLVAQGWGGAAWGLLASALCGGVPAAVIAMGVRSGRLDSHHIVDRARRTGPLLAAVAAVIAALVLLVLTGAPRLLVATVTAMLIALGVTVPITTRWKISFHAAVCAGTVVVLAHVLPALPVAVAGTGVVALVCWARVRLTHHTWPQVAAGAVVGAAVTWGTLAAFGLE